MPLLPASVVAGPDGVYPVVWRFDAVAADAVETIDADNGLAVRDGPVSYDAEPIDVRNDFRIDYAPDANTQKPQRFVQLRAGYDRSNVNELGSYYAEVSAGRFGNATASKTVPIIYDDATARAWQVRARGLLHRCVTYTVPKSFGWLTLGAVVKITDADLSLSSRVALVQAIRWETEETLSITLLIVDDPARDI